MTLDESIQGMRLQVIRRATQIGVSAACAEAGISRTLFYRWHRLSRYGVDGLHPRRLRAQGPPAAGARRGRASAARRRDRRGDLGRAAAGGVRTTPVAARVAASTVQRLLRRHGLATRRERLLVLEHHSARATGLLTQRTRRLLWRLRHGQTRHVEAERPGELLCLDTFYIGKLKGVGPVWQVTACDVASSYGVARILPELSAAAVASFLRTVVVPAVRQAGWSVERVLTDGGGEFKAEFAAACAALGIRHTRIKPRLDQRLRRALAADDSHRALARGLSPPLLHEPGDARSKPSRVHAVLQLRATPSWLPRQGSDPGGHIPRRHGGRSLSSCTTLGR
jgi:Integrase core domain/Helix-turn-helix domain